MLVFFPVLTWHRQVPASPAKQAVVERRHTPALLSLSGLLFKVVGILSAEGLQVCSSDENFHQLFEDGIPGDRYHKRSFNLRVRSLVVWGACHARLYLCSWHAIVYDPCQHLNIADNLACFSPSRPQGPCFGCGFAFSASKIFGMITQSSTVTWLQDFSSCTISWKLCCQDILGKRWWRMFYYLR